MQKIYHFNQNKPIFKAGLTRQMKAKIASCDDKKISKELLNLNIESNFMGNKVIAWCAFQCVKLIKEINNKYGLNLVLPNGIFVEDFNQLNVKNKDAFGFMNFAPTYLHADNKIITPEKTIFFNEFKDMNYKGGNALWDKVDEIADKNFDDKIATTDFFLETFLHEFAHVAHEGNLMSKFQNGASLIKVIMSMLKNKNLSFQNLQHEISQKICQYATTNQLEMTACDLTKRIIDNTSRDSLKPMSNFSYDSPYAEQNLIKKLFHSKNKLDKLLRNTWNGK